MSNYVGFISRKKKKLSKSYISSKTVMRHFWGYMFDKKDECIEKHTVRIGCFSVFIIMGNAVIL